jgi:hypothetical protein
VAEDLLVDIVTNVENVQQYRDLARRLRNGKNDLRKAFRQKILEAGKPAVEDVRAAVMALHITSTHGQGKGQQRRYATTHGGGQTQRRRYAASKAKSARAAANAMRRPAGLRRTIASATGVEATVKGIRIVVRGNKLPANQRTLPRYLDSSKGWRHPTFDHKPWVRQKGGPYFESTISKHAGDFRRKVIEAIDETNTKIKG